MTPYSLEFCIVLFSLCHSVLPAVNEHPSHFLAKYNGNLFFFFLCGEILQEPTPKLEFSVFSLKQAPLWLCFCLATVPAGEGLHTPVEKLFPTPVFLQSRYQLTFQPNLLDWCLSPWGFCVRSGTVGATERGKIIKKKPLSCVSVELFGGEKHRFVLFASRRGGFECFHGFGVKKNKNKKLEMQSSYFDNVFLFGPPFFLSQSGFPYVPSLPWATCRPLTFCSSTFFAICSLLWRFQLAGAGALQDVD